MNLRNINEAYQEVKDWARKLFPCEKPCDSYGVCENCCEYSLIVGGASKALRAVFLKETGEDVVWEAP